MNTNRLLQKEIGTRKDKQYKAGENLLIDLIKVKGSYSSFDPKSTNIYAALKKNDY